MQYWLMKSEPDVFSIDDLKRVKRTPWDGVRNYQARNFMTNDMKPGDRVLFYHSNAEPTGIAGVAEVAGPAAPDRLQFDAKSEYFEKRATKAKPTWFCVPIAFVQKFGEVLSLAQLRATPELAEMALLRKGQRLSIQPVAAGEFACVLRLAKA